MGKNKKYKFKHLKKKLKQKNNCWKIIYPSPIYRK